MDWSSLRMQSKYIHCLNSKQVGRVGRSQKYGL